MSHLHHKVSALIDGELSAVARGRALRHVRGCELCRREIAETLEVKQRLTQLAPAEVSCDLRDLVSGIPGPVAESPSTLAPALRRVVVSLSSVSMFVMVLAYAVGAPETPQPAAVSPPVNELAAEFTDSAGTSPLSDPAVDTTLVSTSQSPAARPVGFATVSRSHGGAQSTATVPVPSDNPRAVALLRSAADAPERVTFQGVRVCRTFLRNQVDALAVRVWHVPDQGTTYAVRGSGQRPGPELFVASTGGQRLAVERNPVDRLVNAFDVAVSGSETILGRRATVVSASKDGELRARFWIDDVTGLLLRRELFVGGRMVRWSGYTSLTTARHGFIPHLPPELPLPPSTTLSTQVAAALTDKGWTYPAWLPGGFRLSFLRQVDTDGGIMRADYTDGLSTVSVFEQRGSLDTSSLAGFHAASFGGHQVYLREGLPMTVVWQSGGLVVTVVTDLPEQIAAGLIGRFPAPPPMTQPDGVSTRMREGLSRLVSAVAP